MTISSATDMPFDLFQVLKQHLGKMLFVFCLVLAAAFAYFVLAKRLYTAEARVFIRLGRETVGLDPTATTNQVVAVQDARENEVNSVQQLVLSRAVAEEVVDAVGAEPILESPPQHGILDRVKSLLVIGDESPRDAAILKFQKRLHAQATERSSVITVSYQGTSAALSAKVLTAVLASARKLHIRINRIEGSDTFFAEQCDRWKREVSRLQDSLRAFKDRTGVLNFSQQRDTQLSHIASFKLALLENEAQVQAAAAQLAKQESALSSEPNHLVVTRVSDMPNSAAQGMRQQLYTVQLKEADLLARYKPEHILVKQAHQEVDAANRLLKRDPPLTQVTEGVNQVREDLRAAVIRQTATLWALRAKSDALRADHAAAVRDTKMLNEQEPCIEQLTRDLELAQASYRSYFQKHEQARIDRALSLESISNLNIMQPPSGSSIPTWPQPVPTLAIGFVLALMASVIVAMMAEYRKPGSTSKSRRSAGLGRQEYTWSNSNGGLTSK
jgi:polysaccharide biosynthesis protein PslE